MKKKIIVTTSWDDGNKDDARLVGLLNKYSLKGTFYVPKECQFRSLSDEEVKKISDSHEVGAHTLTHPSLTKISAEEAREEIFESKKFIENIIGREAEMFCYPKGFYNSKIKKMVKEAGFLGARTVEEFCFSKPKSFYEFGTSIHIYPFPLRKRDANKLHLSRYLFQPLQRKYKNIKKLGLSCSSFVSLYSLSKNLFDCMYHNGGGIFHIWGHSWEIEKYNLWDDLEKIFKYVSGRQSARYMTNGQTLKIINDL